MSAAVDDLGRARALISLHEALGAAEDDLQSVLQHAADSTAALLGGTACLWVSDPVGVGLRATAHSDARAHALVEQVAAPARHGGEGLVSSVVRTGRTVRAAGDELADLLPTGDPAYRECFDGGAAGLLVVPLRARGRSTGALGVARAAGSPAFDDDDTAFAEQVARVVSLSVANAVLLEEVGRAERRAESLAREDDLTGLLNRRGFLDALRSRLADPVARSFLVAVLDMDGFKLVNDGFGHTAGDMVLTSLGARLCAAVPASTPVARLGGDEFALAVEGDDDEQAAALVETAVRACTGTLQVVGLSVPITVSVGTAVPQPGRADEALMQADLAMSRAKRRAGLVAAYDPRLDDPATRRLRDVLELRQSIAGTDMVVQYQPVVPVSGGPPRVEALVRRRVDGRLQAPASWLPLADRAGLMPELTANVLRQVVDQLALWWASGLEVECAVNVPAPVLAAPEAVGTLLRLLDDAGLPRRALSVEVTEGDLVGDQARAALSRCADADIAVAVDDFGTGWSALSYLVDLPLRTLKLDRTFVDGIDIDPRRAAVVRAIVEVAHQLGLRVVAEGVETEAVADTVIDLGADALQGYLYGRPTGPAEVEALLRSRTAVLQL